MPAVESVPEQQTASCQLNISILIKLTSPRGEKNVHHSNIQVSWLGKDKGETFSVSPWKLKKRTHNYNLNSGKIMNTSWDLQMLCSIYISLATSTQLLLCSICFINQLPTPFKDACELVLAFSPKMTVGEEKGWPFLLARYFKLPVFIQKFHTPYQLQS